MPLLNPPLQTSARVVAIRRSRNLPTLPLTRDERPLRIALVTEYYYPHLGGVCEHVHFFAREARRRGHHVDIITSNIPGAEQQPHVIRLGRSQPVYANGSQARVTLGLGLRKDVRRVLREGRYDIVHVHSPLTPVLPILAIEEADCPVVGTFHTYFDESIGYTLGRTFFQKRLDMLERRDRRLALARRSRSIATSRRTGRSFRTASTPTSFIRARRRRRASRTDVPTILFLGRFDPRNGLTTLIDSFRQVKGKGNRGRQAQLVVVGDGPLREHYYKQAQRRQGHHLRRRRARGTAELLRAQLHLRLPHDEGVVRHHAARIDGVRDARRLLRHSRLPRRRGRRA